MAKIASFSAKKSPRSVLARQIANMHTCQLQQNDAPGEAAQIVADAFFDWLVLEIVTDPHPEASAREVCRALLSRVATALHHREGGAA